MSVPVIVYEDHGWQRLLPLVYMRAAFELICGMDSLLQKVERFCPASAERGANNGRRPVSRGLEVWCRPIIAGAVHEHTGLPVNQPRSSDVLLLNGRVRWRQIPEEGTGRESWVGTDSKNRTVCIYANAQLAKALSPETVLDELRTRSVLANLPRRDVSGCVIEVFDWPWELLKANKSCLVEDWNWYMTHPSATDLPQHASTAQKTRRCGVMQGSYLLDRAFIRIGWASRIKPCVVIDAEEGPVWIGNDVTIQPHSYIQGPAYIGDGSLLQAGTIIREGTTIGPVCKVGGEIEASILHSFSNKQHDGFLGHSYIGSWVNIAADCVNSDLKNTYGTIRVPINGREVETGEQFMGMLMGDYSKAGINVSFPTGAVIGFCSSVIAARSPKFVPSFCWLDGESVERFDEARGLALAEKVMQRRGRTISEAEQASFMAVRQQALAVEHHHQLFIESAARMFEQEVGTRQVLTLR